MKVINYRGGVVSFKIPSHWIEEYEPEGGGTFYEDSENSGTLRLNIITFKVPHGKLPECGYDKLLTDNQKSNEKLLKLPSGDGVKSYAENVEENGENLSFFYWEIGHCAPPEKYYLAIFSWTILKNQYNDPKFKKEISMINHELMKIKFHPDLGKL